MKKLLSANYILIISAVCIFVNSLGFNAYAGNQYVEKGINRTEFNTSDEYKSIKSLSFIDSEESMIEIETIDNSDDDDDNSNPLYVFSFKPFEIREYQKYSSCNQKSTSKLFSTYVPLYIKYNNFRL